MLNQENLKTITESCGQAFYAVCNCVMTDAQMKEWAETGKVLPDDCMDANMTLHDIILNHGIGIFAKFPTTNAKIVNKHIRTTGFLVTTTSTRNSQ